MIYIRSLFVLSKERVMKIVTEAYQCEICGYTSTDKAAIATCEQGPKPAFKVGDAFNLKADSESQVPMMCEVFEVTKPEERTHLTRFKVRGYYFPDEDCKELWLNDILLRQYLITSAA